RTLQVFSLITKVRTRARQRFAARRARGSRRISMVSGILNAHKIGRESRTGPFEMGCRHHPATTVIRQTMVVLSAVSKGTRTPHPSEATSKPQSVETMLVSKQDSGTPDKP